jgi:hypothetical protein
MGLFSVCVDIFKQWRSAARKGSYPISKITAQRTYLAFSLILSSS